MFYGIYLLFGKEVSIVMGTLGAIFLIIAGLILGVNILNGLPGIGSGLEKAGHWLAGFGSIIGIFCLVVGIIEIL